MPRDLFENKNFGLGNIDLNNRPKVKNVDGTISTVRSMSFNRDGKEILIPTVSDGGEILSEKEAVNQYNKTGKYLGVFENPESATVYAKQLHKDQEKFYSNNSKPRDLLSEQSSLSDEIARPFLRAGKSIAAGTIGSAADLASLAVEAPIYAGYKGAEFIKEKITGKKNNEPYEPIFTNNSVTEGIKNKFDEATDGLTAPRNRTEQILEIPEEIFGGIAGSVLTGKAAEGVQKSYIAIKNLLNKNKNPEREAINILSKYVDPEEAKILANKLITAEKNNRQTLLPDIASDEVQGLTRLLGKTEGSKNTIADVFSKRTVGSNRRVANAINNKISSEAYFGSLDELSKARAAVSKPLYEQAYKEGNDALTKAVTSKKSSARIGDLKELINDDRITSAIGKARKDYGINKDISDVSIEALHGARQVVDDIISQAKSPLSPEPNKARSYLELKKKINNVLYQVSPTLKEADKTFAGYSALKNAQQEGMDFSKYRPEELKKYMADLSPGEKDAFKVGVRENLMRNVDKTAEGNSSARKIFAKPENRNQLKIIFNNPKEYSDFSRRMVDEVRIFNTKQRILGGSRTDINLAEEGQIINKIASGDIPTTKAGLVKNTIEAVADSIQKKYRGLNEKNSKALAEIVTNRTKSIDALIKIAKKAEPEQQKIAEKAISDIVPIIIGGYTRTNLVNEQPIQTE